MSRPPKYEVRDNAKYCVEKYKDCVNNLVDAPKSTQNTSNKQYNDYYDPNLRKR